MELKILSCDAAREFEPKVKTAAMRIYSGNPYDNSDYGELRKSDLYVAQFQYTFDDIPCKSGDEMDRLSKDGPDENQDICYMSRKTAEHLVRDFISVKDSIECLMVHCRAGQGRSAGMGMALNEAFKFGDNTFRMSLEFPNFNLGVYELVLEAARKIAR